MGLLLTFAARSRFMAAATPSPSLKIADPATSTLAPASTTSGAVVGIDAPVHLQVAPGLDLFDHLADTPNLWQGRVDEMLMAEPRVDRHDQHLIHVLAESPPAPPRGLPD